MQKNPTEIRQATEHPFERSKRNLMAKKRKQAEQSGTLTKRGAFGAVIMVFVAVFVCVVAITLLYTLNNRRLGIKDDASTEADTGSDLLQIEEHLKEIFPQKLEYVPTPTLSDAQAFSKYVTKTSYYRECTVTRSDGNVKSEQTLQILRDEDHYNIKTIENGVLTETLISDGKQACIVNEMTGGISYCPLGPEFTVEKLVGLTDHHELVSLVSDFSAGGTAKEKTGLSSLSLSMFRNKGSNMLVINLSRNNTGTRESYYYYLDYGYVYHTEISLEGTTVFSVSATAFTTDISEHKTPDSFVFPQTP